MMVYIGFIFSVPLLVFAKSARKHQALDLTMLIACVNNGLSILQLPAAMPGYTVHFHFTNML